jgi:homoserine dehydrogenase
VLEIGRVITRYQITLDVADQPGVLAAVARILSDGGVSVETVQQTIGTHSGIVTLPDAAGRPGTAPTATLVIGTHEAEEAALAATVESLAASDVVKAISSVLRVEGS